METNSNNMKVSEIRSSIEDRIRSLVNRTGGEALLPDSPVVTVLSEAGPLQVSVRSLSLDTDGGVSLEARLAADPEEPPYTLSLHHVVLENLTDILDDIPEPPAVDDKAVAAIPDPFILVELSELCYKELYEAVENSVAVQEELIHAAKILTAKYASTDWDDTDVLTTMEDEAEKLIRDFKRTNGQDTAGLDERPRTEAEPSLNVYVGRWDLLPEDLESRIETVEGWTREQAAAEVLRQRKILHSDQFDRYGDYQMENIVDSFTLKQFEELFNGDLEDNLNTGDFWIKIL